MAGPVVASAVIVRDFSFSSPVDDSKKMTPRTRAAACAEILDKCWVGVGVVEHDVIDSVNIFQATMLAMREAVAKLQVAPDCVLVDGGRAPAFAGTAKAFAVVRGDAKSFSIACAS
ncbi:MAG: ribonuclease HII, partial [Candidatus Omnitrophica bacterium]|nr:ribonuclease HII [Candidatus Omnitrophota bacterium]